MGFQLPNPPTTGGGGGGGVNIFGLNGAPLYSWRITTNGAFTVEGFTFSGAGGPSFVNPAATSFLTRQWRGRFQQGAGGFANLFSTNPTMLLGGGGAGGFEFFMFFASGPNFPADTTFYAGLQTTASVIAFDPSDPANNNIGMLLVAANAADANFSFISRPVGAAATGISLGVPKAPNTAFTLYVVSNADGTTNVVVNQLIDYTTKTEVLNQSFINGATTPASGANLLVFQATRSATGLHDSDTIYGAYVPTYGPALA